MPTRSRHEPSPDELASLVRRLGGVATWSELQQALGNSDGTLARRLLAAEASGHIIRSGRCWAVSDATDARRIARSMRGTAMGLTAALAHGWKVKSPPERHHIAVPRGRNVEASIQENITISWRTLSPTDIRQGWITTPLRTVLDCATTLAFAEALTVADSALRARSVSMEQLEVAADALPLRGRRRARLVLDVADGRAAGPNESVLRAIALGVPRLHLIPQLTITRPHDDRFLGRVDLADPHLRIVIEAESWEHHGSRAAFAADVRRYTGFVAGDWVVLRFMWEDIMFDPDAVRAVLLEVTARQLRRWGPHPSRMPHRAGLLA